MEEVSVTIFTNQILQYIQCSWKLIEYVRMMREVFLYISGMSLWNEQWSHVKDNCGSELQENETFFHKVQ